ncbi:protein of unknown function [Thauera humireducens]|nr:protein of unknown function [Thauera humireducens]
MSKSSDKSEADLAFVARPVCISFLD